MIKNQKPNLNTLDDEIDIRNLFFNIWRGKWILLASMVISIFVGIHYIKNFTQETYTARTVFGFNESTSTNFLPIELKGLSSGLGFDKGNSDILTQILGSDFLRQIVSTLDLTKDTEFNVNTTLKNQSSTQKFKNPIVINNLPLNEALAIWKGN